jgi:hypothetical protein
VSLSVTDWAVANVPGAGEAVGGGGGGAITYAKEASLLGVPPPPTAIALIVCEVATLIGCDVGLAALGAVPSTV